MHRKEMKNEKEVVKYVSINMWKEFQGTKNACKVGTVNNGTKKTLYIVALRRDERGKELMEIHTLKEEGKEIEYCPQEAVKNMFMKLSFF